jgi:proteasome lid subunit RPN8/RPN11
VFRRDDRTGRDLTPPNLGPGSGLRLFTADGEDRRPGDCEILFGQAAYLRIVEHLASDTSRELGGLLLGHEIVSEDGSRSTVVVTHSLAARHSKGTPVRLAMTAETWAEFERVTDFLEEQGLGLKRIGWYHSHPNLSIFLSGYDLDVCTVFTRPTQLALVVDPVRDTGGFFVRGTEGFRTHSPQGFWELSDRQANSVVTWKNMKLGDDPNRSTEIATPTDDQERESDG